MIFDQLDRAPLYYPLHVRFRPAFEFLRSLTPSAPAGRIELEGEGLFVLIQEYESKSMEEKQFESHRRYIDIQLILSGREMMGYAPKPALTDPTSPYNEAKDYAHYARPDAGVTWLAAEEGRFAIFFREDAHMPGVIVPGTQQRSIKKAVVKVRYAEC